MSKEGTLISHVTEQRGCSFSPIVQRHRNKKVSTAKAKTERKKKNPHS